MEDDKGLPKMELTNYGNFKKTFYTGKKMFNQFN